MRREYPIPRGLPPTRRAYTMITQSTKMKAITLILLMMVSAMAGCLGNDDDDKDDNTDTVTTPGDGTNSTVNETVPDDTIDVGTVVCGPDGSISIAGSSTVLPLAEAWAEQYTAECSDVTVTVESGGSSSGAGRVCANSAKGTPVDIGDMSRDWKATEANRQANGFVLDCLVGDSSRDVAQFQVAIDGLSVVMKKGGAAETCVNGMGGLTPDQLRWMFSAETAAELTAAGLDMSAVTPNGDNDDSTHKWSELSANCPDAEINLAYPDAASGTYEYFFEAILHEA